MSAHDLYDYGFGKIWETVHVECHSGYYTSVTGYHKHNFYEINLILSGNIKILFKDHYEEGSTNKIVLTRPGTEHYISCNPDTLYNRIYLVFTDEFMSEYLPGWKGISTLFGNNGAVISLTEEETDTYHTLIRQIEKESNNMAKSMLIGYFLCKLSEISKNFPEKTNMPPYVFGALTHIKKHYYEKINFADLSKKLYVGRTTLMTDFKIYTGKTLGEYLTVCRMEKAIQFLLENKTIEFSAEKCGFSDSSGFIRAFKRIYGTTPHKYIKKRIDVGL